MRYLVVVFVLLPVLAFAAQNAEYTLDCELIAGAQCKKACAENETVLKQVDILGGELQGKVSDIVCTKQGKNLKCCVDKAKIKK